MEKVITLISFMLLLALPSHAQAQQTDFNALMERQGLVDIQTLDKDIKVELKYATEDNFVGVNMYGSLTTPTSCPTLPRKLYARKGFCAKGTKVTRFLFTMPRAP